MCLISAKNENKKISWKCTFKDIMQRFGGVICREYNRASSKSTEAAGTELSSHVVESREGIMQIVQVD
jgi:hypothetical protein